MTRKETPKLDRHDTRQLRMRFRHVARLDDLLVPFDLRSARVVDDVVDLVHLGVEAAARDEGASSPPINSTETPNAAAIEDKVTVLRVEELRVDQHARLANHITRVLREVAII